MRAKYKRLKTKFIKIRHPEQSEGSISNTNILELLLSHSRYRAFTLAEVLITLGIIGVVAALTIPVLLNKTEELQYKTAYRKAYADLSNAFNKARYDGEFLPISNGATAVRSNFEAVKANFKVVKSCENSINEGCWIDSCANNNDCSPAEMPAASTEGRSYGFIDVSGRAWSHYKASGGEYLWIILDTNGEEGPNSYGRDRWLFQIEDEFENIANTAGVPFKIKIVDDISAPRPNGCAKGNCYYKSWLIGK